jgi:RimJ/RimL family protein N-acetyltransferase
VHLSLTLAGLSLLRSGFVEEGRERRANFQDGRWWDMISMGILEEEWREQNKQ